MPLSEREVADALAERQESSNVIDRWKGLRTYYRDWQFDFEELHRIYRNEWSMVWPDGRVENVDPAVPNMVRIAVEDRARAVAATPPQIVCRPDGPGDKAREKADKLERVVSAWLEMNRVQGYTTQRWAMDGMGGGLMVCKVLPDFSKPKSERFPVFTRLEPQLSYPDPIFAPGPFLDTFTYSYEDYRRTVEMRYDVKFSWAQSRGTSPEKVTVIEYYDKDYAYVVVQALSDPRNASSPNKPRDMIVSEKHRLSRCPVVISATPKLDGTYGGEFSGGLGVLDFWNRLMTMVMDDAIRKVYPERVVSDVVNPQDYGPDAVIELENPQGRYEYVQQPNQPFSNLQVLRDVGSSVRTSFILPPSRSGDPNESIISAAGVSATQTQFTEDVRSIQRDLLAPLIEAAVDIALESEEVWTPGVKKNIWSMGSGRYRETYRPNEDIDGYRKVQVSYGPMPGLDPINQGVMVMQALGAGILDERTAMELSPFVEDPQRVEKRKLRKQIQDLEIAGLAARMQQGTLDPYVLAIIDQAVDSDEVTLSEAIAALVGQAVPAPAPQAAPVGTAPAQQSQAPGIAGAATGQTQILTNASLSGGPNGTSVRGSSQARTGY